MSEHPTLKQMQAKNLPRMTMADAFTNSSTDPVPAEGVKALDEYLRVFTMPVEGKCICCNLPLGGLLLGTFQWGIAHGEGICGRCGWPARAYHRPKEGPVEFFSVILPYHPDELVPKPDSGQ